ncbi:fimbrial protein [Aeromonas salmonicida]|uniref:Adhesion domain protein n=1 Tax=Aeromonas salmonicida subsp. pectinolytica 34mel TaxID=1324960 RepID=A0A2D1QH71_AERSA|nr:fimbrial protein [Aeromonas salmonicida]ATP09554.1 adhesion domain protein [Aeromonas salmonicida subsp. pectinolytica 34mel]HEH9395684.1 type 1 fimbrial protein [Aeromonas salmonicida]
MKKNILALTALMVLSATAHAELKDSENTLHINGKVVLDGCAFEDGTIEGKVLNLELGEVSLASVKKAPTDIFATIGGDSSTALVCPPGIASVKMAFTPAADSYKGDVLLNIKESAEGGAAGVGFKVKAALGADLTGVDWIDFSNPEIKQVSVSENGKVDMIFGANYALSDELSNSKPGDVEANLPFVLSYM